MKNVVFIFILFSIVFLVGFNLMTTSFGYSYDIDNSVLFYKDNYEELEMDIKKYLSNIDDYIILNSSYIYGDRLVDNYDSLVYIVTDYIINNKEYYNEDIKQLDECFYINNRGIDSSGVDYINLDRIYEITDFYFGIRDFSIINDGVCIKDNYISLIDYTTDKYNFEIVDVNIVETMYGVDALVYYDNGDKFLYNFENINNVLKIKNVGVV